MTEKIKRKFKFNDINLEDPDETFSPIEVAKYYSMQFPELTNGSVDYKGLVIDSDGEYMSYELSNSIGVKG